MNKSEAEYILVSAAAQQWNISVRSVCHYCAQGRVEGAWIEGRSWRIPLDAQKPERSNRSPVAPSPLLCRLRKERESRVHDGAYHMVQVALTYHSNRIEGSRLTEEQTRSIFETKTIENSPSPINVDDIIIAVNHFRCIDLVIERSHRELSESFILLLHQTLMRGTSREHTPWFAIGWYKLLPNEVGGIETTRPEDVKDAMASLLDEYNSRTVQDLDDLLEFHHRFETIHPFQDCNGRIGRLILFKECLKHRIVPFIITEELKLFYYRGLAKWNTERGYLLDTALSAQDQFRQRLEYFRIPY